MKVEQFYNIIRAVTDIDASLHFYRDLLGLKLERIVNTQDNPAQEEFHGKLYNVPSTRYRGAILGDGKTPLVVEIIQYLDPLPGSMPEGYRIFDAGFTRFTVIVSDVKAAYEELKAEGVKFVGPPVVREDGSGNVLARDPDGNIVGLRQVPNK